MKEIEKITSRDNRRLVRARGIRDGKDTSLILIEGRRLVEEALRSALVIDECFVAEGFGDRELLRSVAERTSAIAELPERIFSSIADTNHPQGIILTAKRPESSRAELEARLTSATLPIVVFLKEINNPSNLGAILRTAEAADIAGVIVSRDSADVFSPKATRAAMGANFRIEVLQNETLDKVLEWAESRYLAATAADISASQSYIEINWKRPRLLIHGSEAHGLDDVELARIQESIRIPMANDVESLNLAVTAGIILFETKRPNS